MLLRRVWRLLYGRVARGRRRGGIALRCASLGGIARGEREMHWPDRDGICLQWMNVVASLSQLSEIERGIYAAVTLPISIRVLYPQGPKHLVMSRIIDMLMSRGRFSGGKTISRLYVVQANRWVHYVDA
eukprot:GHVU01212430.1.p1 GENE.GHVU01212430.1~~GHVU01212430.1.p1  ORF type:complete len:129 (-),score=0.77 GHVU01212430.1:36-422(-)